MVVMAVARSHGMCNLVLEGKDGADAAVDGLGDARLRLVADGAGRVRAHRRGHPRQHLRHVAGAEHFVHGRELRRAAALPPASSAEVRREHAPGHAAPLLVVFGLRVGRCALAGLQHGARHARIQCVHPPYVHVLLGA
jgi:hypothetical protein